MKWGIFFIGLCLIIVTKSYSQNYPRKEFDPSSLVDEIFATQDLDIDYQDLYENYLQLISNPIDLNSITKEQLAAFYILSPQQINSFINYREQAGKLLSVYELQNVEGFTKELFLKLVPFVKVTEAGSVLDKSIFQRISGEKNNYLLLRYALTLEEQQGYAKETDSSRRYAGSPGNFYARFRTSRPGDFSLGFTLEKDAGENINWNPSKKYYGFDYISFHAQIVNKQKIKNLIVGDYQAQFGQGIALGSVFGIGKNGEAVTTVRRSNLGFLPYTSIYEAGYFRGAAITYELVKNFTVHTMLSSRGRDGNLLDTIQNVLSSFNFSGLHRTPSELANRNSLTENNLAVVANYKNKSLDAGLIFHTTQFSIPIFRKENQYNQFAFKGGDNTNVGAFLNYSIKNVSIFSEFVQTIQHGQALVAGILASITPKLDISMLYRKFDRNFYSFYSNALAENSIAQNESGFYWGWKYSFSKKYSLAGYVDLFQFPWLKFRNYALSEGSEWLIRFNYKPSKTVSFFLQAREEIRQRNTSADVNLYLTDLGTKRNYWVNLDYSATPYLIFKSRAQFSTFDFSGESTQGVAVMQDASLDWRKFSMSGRYVLFDTDDFDNRLYVYEKDVWLAFTFPAYSGRGVRHFLVLQYRLSEKIDFWVRWAQTRFTDRDIIGSGGEAILGNSRNDVRFQVRIRF